MAQRLQAKASVNRLQADTAQHGSYRVPFQVVSVEEMLVENNWENIRETMDSVPEGRFNVLQFFSYKSYQDLFKPQLDDLMKVTQAYAIGLGDETIETAFKAMAETSEHLKLVRARRPMGEGKQADDRRVVFRQHPGSNVVIEAYERGQREPQSTVSHEFPWVFLRKENLAFEREKVMTLLFVERRLAFLKNAGHTNLNVVLERPVPKHDTSEGSHGFVDLGLFSTGPDGRRYGQLYEFKAWSRVGAMQAFKLHHQAINYNVDQWMGHSRVDASHDGGPVNQVLGLNLDMSNYLKLAQAPWVSMPNGLLDMFPLNSVSKTTSNVLRI